MSASSIGARPEVAELTLLLEISSILDDSLELRNVLGPTVKALNRTGRYRDASIRLLNRDTGSLVADEGASSATGERGAHAAAIAIRVVKQDKPVLVVRLDSPASAPTSRRRTGDEAPVESYVCVPIRLDKHVVGALGAFRDAATLESLEEDKRLLQIVASMVARSVRLRQEALEEQERLRNENSRLQRELRHQAAPPNIIGRSKAMQEVYDLLGQVADSSTTVLILGESGTGKELVAEALHHGSSRRNGPLVKVNCGALPESIVESELFGHERGAFTGATAQRKGRFELADGGTIFLDEIGELSQVTQVKLLRILQEREFERVGGTSTHRVDVRVIAATSRDLERMVEQGTFRQDLYYRLNVFPLHMPPLRERGSDVILLADHFVAKYNRRHLKQVRRIATSALDMLTAYHWPGNVRELENCIERAVLLSTDDVIHGHHLPPSLQTAEGSGTGFAGNLDDRLERVEQEYILDALKSSRGNMARAARMLGITERIMGLRIRKYAIDPRRFVGRH